MEGVDIQDQEVGTVSPQGTPQGNPQGSPQGNPVDKPTELERPNVNPLDVPKVEGDNPEPLPRLAVEDYHSPEVANILHTVNALMPTIDVQRAFGEAIASGDSSAIDVNYIREMLGDVADPIIQTMAGVADAYGNTSDTVYQEVFDSVGGQEQWQGIADFFNSNATELEKREARRLTTSKNPNEIREGAEYVKTFAQRMGAMPKTPVGIQAGAGNVGGAGLTEEQHLEEYWKIRNSDVWNDNPQQAELMIQRIDEQRMVAKRQGR